jgi:hypothetical protein
MTKQQFEEVILKLQLTQLRSQQLYKLGVDLMEIEEPYHNVIDILFSSCFNDEQMGWIDWFLYERVGINGKILKATKKVGRKKVEICYDIDSLWETVCEAGQQNDFDNRVGG